MYAVGYAPPSAPQAVLTTEYSLQAVIKDKQDSVQKDTRVMASMKVCMDESMRLMDLNDPNKKMRIYTANGGVTIFTFGETKTMVKYSCTEQASAQTK